MRIAMPDAACKSVDVPLANGRKVRYQPDRSGSVEVADPKHARALIRDADCFVATGHTIPHAPGFPCASCGFGSLFVVCGRCGTENPRG